MKLIFFADMNSMNLTAAAGPQKHHFSCAVKADRSRRHLAVRAQAGPSNPIGIHAQVWVGDWSKDEAVKAIKGTKEAGYDIIERKASSACSDLFVRKTPVQSDHIANAALHFRLCS